MNFLANNRDSTAHKPRASMSTEEVNELEHDRQAAVQEIDDMITILSKDKGKDQMRTKEKGAAKTFNT